MPNPRRHTVLFGHIFAAASVGLLAATLLTPGAATGTTSSDAARAVATVPADQQLSVQGETTASQGINRLLTTATVTTTTTNEVRALHARLPIAFTRDGAAALPDRLYHSATVRCIGAVAPGATSHQRNILLGGTTALTPRGLVMFRSPGTYTCELRYRLLTSYVYNDTTDDVTTLAGGYLIVSGPQPAWSRQCYWPTTISQQPAECDVSGVHDVASVKVLPGQTADRRTPVRATIPPGTEFVVQADVAVTGCGGHGGNEGMCGADEGSGTPSTVSGRISIAAPGSADASCAPRLIEGGTADLDIAVKTHHSVLYNAGRWRTSSNPACSTEYFISNTVTVAAGVPVIVHRNGSALSISG